MTYDEATLEMKQRLHEVLIMFHDDMSDVARKSGGSIHDLDWSAVYENWLTRSGIAGILERSRPNV